MKAKIFRACYTFVMLAIIFAMAPLELSARTLGMVADNETDSVTVFDADTHAVLGTVPILPGDPRFSFIGDVLITPDLKLGFATSHNRQIFVIDLTTSPPSLAGGTNPIPLSALGTDLAISPDGKFLVVSDSFAFEPISVIDIAARAEISTFFSDPDSTSVDVCSDGSVLITSFESGTVRRLTLSGAGILTDTGEVLSVRFPTNVYCAPGARSGVVTRLEGVTSFTIPGLAEVDNRFLSGASGTTGAINLVGNRVFVRSSLPSGPGIIDVFVFNPTTGVLGADPLLTFSVGDFGALGIEHIALHSNSEKLFVSELGAVNVYNPNTGALITSITDPNIVSPTGVTVQMERDPCALPPPPGAIVGTNGSDVLNGTSGNDMIFGLSGTDIINGGRGNDVICGGDGNDVISGGSGNDTLDGGPGSDVMNGGAGNDTCTADAGDVVSNCNP